MIFYGSRPGVFIPLIWLIILNLGVLCVFTERAYTVWTPYVNVLLSLCLVFGACLMLLNVNSFRQLVMGAMSLRFGDLVVRENGEAILEFHYPPDAFTAQSPIKCRIPVRRDVDHCEVHGRAQFWHPSEQRAGGIDFVAGKPHGEVTTWHPNGTRKLAGTWSHGFKEGVWTHWNDDGTLAMTENYQDGHCVERQGTIRNAWHELFRHYWTYPVVGQVELHPREVPETSGLLKACSRVFWVSIAVIAWMFGVILVSPYLPVPVHVEDSIDIATPVDQVFPRINNLQRWEE
jgi:hypothetical protein